MKILGYGQFTKLLFWKKEEKIDPPEIRAIIKLSDTAKESGVYDDENKYIELINGSSKKRIPYSDADVEALREQGIPVDEEKYSDEFDFIESKLEEGGVEGRR